MTCEICDSNLEPGHCYNGLCRVCEEVEEKDMEDINDLAFSTNVRIQDDEDEY